MELRISKRLHGADGELNLNVDITIPGGQLVALYGPTGSGKSSLLRMIAGLMRPDAGNIVVQGETWFDSAAGVNLRPQSRNIGMVFQDYSLFPNMTVRENLKYALQRGENSEIIDELLGVVEMMKLQHRKPHLLSGGQRQRVALARALVRRPRLLLLDEPLSALDEEMRSKLQHFILRFHREMELTSILVTHDLREVLKLSERVLVLESGKFKRDCSPQELL